MEETCFIDLIKEENISRIDIDKRLIEPFKLAMIKMQEYFNKNNYVKGKKYNEFFKEFLLDDSERKLEIIISDPEEENKYAGAYSSKSCSILVNENYINSDINKVAHIICHEFIHFIAHHKKDILYGTPWGSEEFIDEGFTEQLAREIIPVEIDYYGAIPNLIDFYNKLYNVEMSYSILLDGKIRDLLRASSFPKSFVRYGDECMKRFKDGEYIEGGYETDECYLNIQRDIIENWNNYEVNDYDSFMSFINIINNRPADDREWIIDYVINKCKNIINDEETKQLIIDYVNVLNIISRHVYRFNVGDVMLTFDGNNILGLTPDIKYYFTTFNGKDLLVFYNDKGIKVELDYKNIIVLDNNEIFANKTRLEGELESRISSGIVR